MTEKLSERVTNPAWPKGATVERVINMSMADSLGCHWCGRKTKDPLKGHDGFCPILFLRGLADAADEENIALKQWVERLREALREIAHGKHSGRAYANQVLSETGAEEEI